MTTPAVPRFWELLDRAMATPDATALHLTVGRPPMIRIAEQGIRPLDEQLPVMTYRSIQYLLGFVVDPDRWQHIEAMGEGEITLVPPGDGRPVVLTIFRSSEAWSAVAHL
jgi:Tfp pilus assembly pilus retraction ATPase PilT